jgi:hypothetical protein
VLLLVGDCFAALAMTAQNGVPNVSVTTLE